MLTSDEIFYIRIFDPSYNMECIYYCGKKDYNLLDV